MPESGNHIRRLPFEVQLYILEQSLPQVDLSWARVGLRIASACSGLDELLIYSRACWEGDAYLFIDLYQARISRIAGRFLFQLWWDACVVGFRRRETLARVDILRRQVPLQIDLETYLEQLRALYMAVAYEARSNGIDPEDVCVPDFHLANPN